jgi:hypothetical protein
MLAIAWSFSDTRCGALLRCFSRDPHMGNQQGSNGYDATELNRYLGLIDREDDELLALKASYMSQCRGPRGRIKDILLQAKEVGCNMVAFREVLAKHRSGRNFDKRIAELEADDRDSFEAMLDALGQFAETELGRAALDRTRPRQDGDQMLDTLR